ncbi:MAG: hypothetical protein IPL26_26695 [Leptospiraceae bacterium]|nr:hypothetical protein [Leptospiraceae bacterium]
MERKLQIIGLLGFIVSGITFMVSSIKNGDYWALSGSILWIISCIVWIIPLLK